MGLLAKALKETPETGREKSGGLLSRAAALPRKETEACPTLPHPAVVVPPKVSPAVVPVFAASDLDALESALIGIPPLSDLLLSLHARSLEILKPAAQVLYACSDADYYLAISTPRMMDLSPSLPLKPDSDGFAAGKSFREGVRTDHGSRLPWTCIPVDDAENKPLALWFVADSRFEESRGASRVAAILRAASTRARRLPLPARATSSRVEKQFPGEGWAIAGLLDPGESAAAAASAIPGLCRMAYEAAFAAAAERALGPEGIVLGLGEGKLLMLLRSPVEVDARLAMVQAEKSVGHYFSLPRPQLTDQRLFALRADDPTALSVILSFAGV